MVHEAIFMKGYPAQTFHKLWCYFRGLWKYVNNYISRQIVIAQVTCLQNSKATVERKFKATGWVEFSSLSLFAFAFF